MSSGSSTTDTLALKSVAPDEEERTLLRSRIQALEAELAASRERASELVKANMTLKRSLDALATEPELDKCLGLVLRAITEQLSADSSVLWLTDFRLRQLSRCFCRENETRAVSQKFSLLSGR